MESSLDRTTQATGQPYRDYFCAGFDQAVAASSAAQEDGGDAVELGSGFVIF